MSPISLTRRHLIAAAGAALTLPAVARAELAEQTEQAEEGTRHNISGFRSQDWRDHFDTLGKATIVADTASRALHYWSGDGSDYRIYPTSVPKTDELTKRGYTEVVRKAENPSWTPTASMREDNPDLPERMEGGPGNPLGTRAMYLSWPAYLVHGTHDTRKIGRQSSSGCIGLYNHQVEELYELVQIGTQVRLL